MTDQTVALLQLVKRYDADNSDVNTLDFLALPTELQYQGWVQGLPQPGKSSVDEVITLVMNAGNADTLATALQAIDTKIKEIGWAQDPLNPVGVWLRAQLTGETNPRQCFVLSANRPQRGLNITSPLAYSGIIPDYGLGLTRMPAWENTTLSAVNQGLSTITSHGGMLSYTVAGDAHARVSLMLLLGGGSSTFNETWVGAKSGRYGVNPANFVPVWNLKDGTYTTTPDTTSVADATALSGTNRTCTFATTTTMAYRAIVPLSAVTANMNDQRGKYIVLLRAKTSNSSLVCNVRVGQGYLASVTDARSFAFQPRVQLSAANTGWRYYSLGSVKIPPTGGFFTGGSFVFDMSNVSLGIQAEYVSGTGNLLMDNLLLIPAEHSIHASGTGFGGGVLGGSSWTILTRPDKKYYTLAVASSKFFESPAIDQIDWSLPSGTNNTIVFAGSSASTATTDTLAPILLIYPSYSSLRGAA